MQIPKELPWESPKYRKFIREHSCCVCGRFDFIEAHHEPKRGRSTLSQKVSDKRCLPLCKPPGEEGCHGKRHSKDGATFFYSQFIDPEFFTDMYMDQYLIQNNIK